MLEQIRDIFEIEKDEAKEIVKYSSLKRYSEGVTIFSEGESSKSLHILISGVVKVSKFNQKEVVLHHFIAPTLIAEITTLENIPYPATAISESDVEIIEIDSEKFRELLLKNSKVSLKIILSLTKKIKALENLISNSLVLDSKSKVAKFLYQSELSFRELKQHKIATILNIEPETLSRVLKSLRNENIISGRNRDLKVKDREKLKSLFLK